MSRLKPRQSPELTQARDLLRGLAAAFDSGTWDGIHRFARTNDIFERLTPDTCDCCGRQSRVDLLEALYTTVAAARNGVMAAKARATA